MVLLQSFTSSRQSNLRLCSIALLGAFFTSTAFGQAQPGPEASASCSLKNHVYTCDGVAFQKALSAAKSVAIETHNTDGVGQAQLKSLIAAKLGKSVAPQGSPSDLVFLMIPNNPEGTVSWVPGQVELGTLRIYSTTPTGERSQLLWAETYSGAPDLPWPIVVRRLIAQFQSRFKIK